MAGGQSLPPRVSRPGAVVTTFDRSYNIRGNTAQDLLDMMRLMSPGGGWTSFRWRYEWSYRVQNSPTSAGYASDRCIIADFEMRFDVDAVFPKWERPGDAPPELVAAWEAFEEDLFEEWQTRRNYWFALAREASREVRLLEEPCPMAGQVANRRVRDLQQRPTPAQRDIIGQLGRVRLRWPPEGFEDLLPEPVYSTVGERMVSARAVGAGFTHAAASDVRPSGMTGVVAGRRWLEQGDSIDAVGFADMEGTDTLTQDALFRFPAFTHVIVSSLAEAQSREGLLDLHAPLSSLLPGLDTRLGRVTLHHLLSHQSGIDDASARSSDWSEILDDLDDRAVFTDPGAVYSYSRYDYPLAVRALEAATDEDLEAAAIHWIFEPLGMVNTSFGETVGGLPVVVTTAPDLLRFGAAWEAGGIGDEILSPGDSASTALLDGNGRKLAGGLWVDSFGGRLRATLMCSAGPDGDAAWFQILPDQGLVLALWSRTRSPEQEWPTVSAQFLLEEVTSKLGAEPDSFLVRTVRGDGELQTGPRPCEVPSAYTARVDDPGSPAPAGDWAGRYSNGDRIFDLEDRDGFLWLPAGMGSEFQVTHFKDDLYFATIAERPLWPFRLVRDREGRRYAVLGDKAHIHEDDRLGG